MAGWVLDGTASTTLDHVEAVTHGSDWREETTAALDLGTPADDPDAVVLDFITSEQFDAEHEVRPA